MAAICNVQVWRSQRHTSCNTLHRTDSTHMPPPCPGNKAGRHTQNKHPPARSSTASLSIPSSGASPPWRVCPVSAAARWRPTTRQPAHSTPSQPHWPGLQSAAPQGSVPASHVLGAPPAPALSLRSASTAQGRAGVAFTSHIHMVVASGARSAHKPGPTRQQRLSPGPGRDVEGVEGSSSRELASGGARVRGCHTRRGPCSLTIGLRSLALG